VAEKHEAPGISKTVSSARQAWDQRYAGGGLVWGSDPNVFLVEHLNGLSPRRALDLGCGQGRNALWLARQGHEVTGLDVSSVAIDQARALAAEAGLVVHFRAVDLARDWQPEPDSFDLIVLSYLQLPESTRRAVHTKAATALAPGGTIFLIAHHSDNLEHGAGGPPYPDVLFCEADIEADFAGLVIERNDMVRRPIDVHGERRIALDLVAVITKPV
jgi:SAM-dependent methyltransferase